MATGALLYLAVPGVDGPNSDMNRNAQLGHTYYFNLSTLRQLPESAGLEWLQGDETVQAVFQNT